MHSSSRIHDTTSTPKRRRLGTANVLRLKNHKSVIPLSQSPINFNIPRSVENSPQRCESPHLPCNQVEYLCVSNNSSTSDIPCSPGVINNSIIKDIENWESLVVSTNKMKEMCNKESVQTGVIEELDDISEDMFRSKLDQSNYVKGNVSKLEDHYIEDVEQSFDEINESICQMMDTKKYNKSSMFETKDSFLLDVNECEIAIEESKTKVSEKSKIDKPVNIEGFYGLPMITKALFKTYRNIEKFYDWQEECLNLDAIKERRNLIYALPTSGGKTLVAEVLMLREVLVRKKNVLFILPFVAIVQEKILALSPFAVQLDFLVEEYAGGKGHIPPKKRRKKNSMYIATIEKGLGLIRSLLELDRLNEIGLIVVDELHLIGEKGRGGTLETLLTTVLFTNQNIQIIGMSATIGNLAELAQFLRADVFQREFRPVELKEYVKLGDMLYRILPGPELEIEPARQLTYDYTSSAARLDPDRLAGLVSEVVPQASCLVFCPTKKNCENVAALLCNLLTPEMRAHRPTERRALVASLRGAGAVGDLWRAAAAGVAFHHAGLAPDERALIEQAFRSGVISVLCCTSTLAAGVNLPAARVIIRAPRVARHMLTLAAYRQMTGRAGRAGVCDTGESIIICSPPEWAALKPVLSSGLTAAKSWLLPSELALSAVALNMATNRAKLRELLGCTLMAVAGTEDRTPVDIKSVCDSSLLSLLRSGAIELVKESKPSNNESHALSTGDCYIYNDTELRVSKLGNAAIKGCMDLATARQLLSDIERSSRALVLAGALHLLYLVTPHDAAGLTPDYRHYYSLYCNLDEEGVLTAKTLGITEMNAIRMMTGKPITTVPEIVLCRFYLALMLHDLWKEVPFSVVAEKYCVPRGTVQHVVTSSCTLAASAQRLAEALPQLWPYGALLRELALRLQHCAAPHLRLLMELPAVQKSRALQLARAGYRRVEQVARAAPAQLAAALPPLSLCAAARLVSAARMMLIEKVENLRAEAEEVMEELKV